MENWPLADRFSETCGITNHGIGWRKDVVNQCLELVAVCVTLRASLSGTFLQTLPDLVTPLKGHSLSPRSCPPTRSAPAEKFGY